jgi:cell division protease FtsH
VTTGAASDIQQATSIARRYVTQWGLSDTIGPILVGDNEQELFLGREIQSRREVSEQTAQLVDGEVKRVATEAHARAVAVLTEHRTLLDSVALGLLERETLSRDDIVLLKDGQPLPPRRLEVLPATPATPAAPVPPARPATPPLLGGPEVAPA